MISCKSIDYDYRVDMEYALNPSTTIPPKPFNLELSPEFLYQRIDLYRSREFAGLKYIIIPYTRKREYGNIGVYLGNGLYIDYNNNLSIDLIKYFDIDLDKTDINTKYLFERGKLFNIIDTVNLTSCKRGNVIKKYRYINDNPFPEKPNEIIELYDDFIRINSDRLVVNSKTTITLNADSLNFDGGWYYDNYSVKKVNENFYRVPFWPNDLEIKQVAQDTIFAGDLIAIRTDKEIQICDIEPELQDDGSYKVNKHIVFKKDGFIFYDEYQQGYAVQKINDSTIHILYNDLLAKIISLIDVSK